MAASADSFLSEASLRRDLRLPERAEGAAADATTLLLEGYLLAAIEHIEEKTGRYIIDRQVSFEAGDPLALQRRYYTFTDFYPCLSFCTSEFKEVLSLKYFQAADGKQPTGVIDLATVRVAGYDNFDFEITRNDRRYFDYGLYLITCNVGIRETDRRYAGLQNLTSALVNHLFNLRVELKESDTIRRIILPYKNMKPKSTPVEYA